MERSAMRHRTIAAWAAMLAAQGRYGTWAAGDGSVCEVVDRSPAGEMLTTWERHEDGAVECTASVWLDA